MGRLSFIRLQTYPSPTGFGSRSRGSTQLDTMANATGPQMAYYGSNDATFGYPAGMTVVDFVPENLKHLVHGHWYSFPPVNPMWHYLLGVIYIFLGFFSIVGNSLVIYLYMKASHLKTPANMLVVNLALSDLIMLTSNFPSFAYNCFHGGVWMWSESFCSIYAALGAVTGVCSIWTLGMISWDRYNIICNGFNGPKLTQGKATLEGILDSCSYDYLSQDFNTRSYNMCIIFF